MEPFAQGGLLRLLTDERATGQLFQLPLNSMYPTRHTRAYPRPEYEDLFSDDPAPMPGKAGKEENFPSKLKALINHNQLKELQCQIQEQPDAWTGIRPEELGGLLLEAVKRNYSGIVDELIKKSTPGKVAAIPMHTQLALVEAARLRHNDAAKMSRLLNALLEDADFPVQRFEKLVQIAREEKKYALEAELLMCKQDFVETRQRQFQHAIYDAAAAGDTAKLQKELDAKLGIPPPDDSLSGVEWFVNVLHRWVAQLFSTSAAKSLVNQQMGKVPLLHAAVASGSKETVLLLVGKGADTSAVDADGHTALSRARELNKTELVNVLQSHGAPQERANAAGSPAATTVSASNPKNHVMHASEHRASAASLPSSDDTVQLFNQLMPNVAASLSGATLQEEMNNGKDLSIAQRSLLTAGYLAEFVPPTVKGTSHRRQETSADADGLAVQLRQHAVEFRACGERIEASRREDIHQVLDNLASIDFGDLHSNPDTTRGQLRTFGLCERLIEAVIEVWYAAVAERDWVYARDSLHRKEILVACLEEKLRRMNNASAAKKRRDRHPNLENQLLLRQIALLDNYCKTARELLKASTGQTTDFSDSF